MTTDTSLSNFYPTFFELLTKKTNMKNFAVLVSLLFLTIAVWGQKKNGTVYVEHESIDFTRSLWQSIQNGDTEKVKTFFADSMMVVRNGNDWETTAEVFGNNSGWWKENFMNLKVEDSPGAYPDAIEYEDGGIWVQDWLTISGIHTKSGIRLDLHLHNLYAFDEDGKIGAFIQYYNNDIFEEINSSGAVRENGKIYINHPFISKVRKLANAYCAEDLETMMSFYHDDARFSNISMDWQESIDKAARKETLQQQFAGMDDIQMKQIGYPDCVYYAESDSYEVYSWWEYSFTINESGKKVVMPLMLSHTLDKEGNIMFELAYFSTNHVDD